MTTQKQIQANRRNANKRSGPTTTPGKGITKLNALKHGLCAEQVVLPGEEPKDFEALRQRLVREIAPEDLIEEQLVDWIAMSMWRMKRGAAFEAALLTYLRLQKELEIAGDEARLIDSEEELADLKPGLPESAQRTIDALMKEKQAWEKLKSARAVLGSALEKGESAIANVMRYQVAAQNSLCRALRELNRKQANEQARPRNLVIDEEGQSDRVVKLSAKR